MYQFLIATQGFNNATGLQELTDKDGNKTGLEIFFLWRLNFQRHLVGLLNRTIQFLENGVKPIWVFDGKAPTLKNGEVEYFLFQLLNNLDCEKNKSQTRSPTKTRGSWRSRRFRTSLKT